jgi:hypothetical protein
MGSFGFKWVYLGSKRFIRVQRGSKGSKEVQSRFIKVQKGSKRFKGIHRGSLGFIGVQIG